MFSSVAGGKATATQFFNQWVETAKRHVPKDQLLVFEVKQGWAPLCKFLGVPIPDTPFPRVNDSASMMSLVNNLERMAWALTLGVPTVLGAVAYLYRESFTQFLGF